MMNANYNFDLKSLILAIIFVPISLAYFVFKFFIVPVLLIIFHLAFFLCILKR